jgi:hypothetical protein
MFLNLLFFCFVMVKGEDHRLEFTLFLFTLVAGLGFLSSSFLNRRFEWVGFGYAVLYLVFSVVLGISVYLRRRRVS